jgi:hypothetical protein
MASSVVASLIPEHARTHDPKYVTTPRDFFLETAASTFIFI